MSATAYLVHSNETDLVLGDIEACRPHISSSSLTTAALTSLTDSNTPPSLRSVGSEDEISSDAATFADEIQSNGTAGSLATFATKYRPELDQRACTEDDVRARIYHTVERWDVDEKIYGHETAVSIYKLVKRVPGGSLIILAPQAELKRADFLPMLNSTDGGWLTQKIKNLRVSSPEFESLFMAFTEHSSNDRWPDGHEAAGKPKDGAILMLPSGHSPKAAVKVVGLPLAPSSWPDHGTRHETAMAICCFLNNAIVFASSDSGEAHCLVRHGELVEALQFRGKTSNDPCFHRSCHYLKRPSTRMLKHIRSLFIFAVVVTLFILALVLALRILVKPDASVVVTNFDKFEETATRTTTRAAATTSTTTSATMLAWISGQALVPAGSTELEPGSMCSDAYTKLPTPPSNLPPLDSIVVPASGSTNTEDAQRVIQAAKAGKASSQWKLGLMYIEGDGVEQNLWQAKAWLEMAASQGHVLSQIKLAWLFRHKAEFGPAFYSEGIRWLEKAAEHDAFAQVDLGIVYQRGMGVLQDEHHAVCLFRKAALQNFPRAMTYLAIAYAEGKGVQRNCTKAVNLFKRAARANHNRAQVLIGHMYLAGDCVAKDEKKAKAWLTRAAKMADAPGGTNPVAKDAVELLRGLEL